MQVLVVSSGGEQVAAPVQARALSKHERLQLCVFQVPAFSIPCPHCRDQVKVVVGVG